jgi:hypothetical protein
MISVQPAQRASRVVEFALVQPAVVIPIQQGKERRHWPNLAAASRRSRAGSKSTAPRPRSIARARHSPVPPHSRPRAAAPILLIDPLTQALGAIIESHAWPRPPAPALAEPWPSVVLSAALRPFGWPPLPSVKALASLEPQRTLSAIPAVASIRSNSLTVPFLARPGRRAGVVALRLDRCHWQREPQCHDCEYRFVFHKLFAIQFCDLRAQLMRMRLKRT